METLVFGLLLLAIAIGYFFVSLVTILPNETGWRTILGAHGKDLPSGTHFCAKWISHVARYRKTPLVFKFKVSSATTKNGFVKGYRDDVSEIERTDLDVLITLVTYFDHANLSFTAANAPGYTAKDLGPVIEPFIQDIVRSVATEIPWPLFIGQKEKVTDYILARIIPEYEYSSVEAISSGSSNIYSFDGPTLRGETRALMLTKNPLVQFGLDTSRTTVRIEDINFSIADMSNKLNAAEEARMAADAERIKIDSDVLRMKKEGEIKAESDALAVRKKGEADAYARNLMIKEIKDNPDLEYLRTLEQMAKGTSNTILYQIPKRFEEKVSQILGGGRPEEWSTLLQDPKITQALQEALVKLTKKTE